MDKLSASTLNSEALKTVGGVRMSDTKDVDCSGFAYRYNKDGSIDSICLTCYLTVATANDEASLHQMEKLHRCERDSI